MHPHAEIFRAIADGRQVLAKRPWEDDFQPIDMTGSSGLCALHNPAGMIPSGWQFKVQTDEVPQ